MKKIENSKKGNWEWNSFISKNKLTQNLIVKNDSISAKPCSRLKRSRQENGEMA